MFTHRLTERADLRLLEARHAEAFFAVVDANRPYLRPWLPWVDRMQTLSDVAAYIKVAQQYWADGKGMEAGIWADGVMAGGIGFHATSLRHRSTSIGYWLAPAFQGQGLMTTACKALIEHAFRDLGLHRIEIRCASGNHRSRAIPERLGFTMEGTLQDAQWLHDHFVDMVVYGLTAPRWRERP